MAKGSQELQDVEQFVKWENSTQEEQFNTYNGKIMGSQILKAVEHLFQRQRGTPKLRTLDNKAFVMEKKGTQKIWSVGQLFYWQRGTQKLPTVNHLV